MTATTAEEAAAPFEEEEVIKISDIKIGNNRLRKDVGDVSSLAASIARDGLYHPIGIDEDNNLIFGFRRIKAYEFLGRTEIPYTRVYIKNALQAEYDENVERKNFTITEIADIYKAVQDSRIGHRPKKGAVSAPFPKGKTREVTAKIAGHGKGEVKKIVELVNVANETPNRKPSDWHGSCLKDNRTYSEILRDVEQGKTKLSKAYNMIKLDQKRLRVIADCEANATINYAHEKMTHSKQEEEYEPNKEFLAKFRADKEKEKMKWREFESKYISEMQIETNLYHLLTRVEEYKLDMTIQVRDPTAGEVLLDREWKGGILVEKGGGA